MLENVGFYDCYSSFQPDFQREMKSWRMGGGNTIEVEDTQHTSYTLSVRNYDFCGGFYLKKKM
jgi:hypothetical protein